MTRRGAGVPGAVALAVVLSAACGKAPDPAVPDPDRTGMEPRVVEALLAARQDVLDAPDSAAAWGRYGAVCQAHRLLAEAEACYRRATELEPGDFRWAYLLAVTRESAGADPDELIGLFGAAERLEPRYAPLHVRLGDALSIRGRPRDALAAFERGIEAASDLAAAHLGAGRALLSLGDLATALGHLERAAELDPGDGAAAAALTQAHQRLGRPAPDGRAARGSAELDRGGSLPDPVFEREVVLRGVSSSRAMTRAAIRLRLEDFPGAIEDLAIVADAHPEDPAVHYWLGIAHRGAGAFDVAAAALARAVELDPAQARARVELARTLDHRGDHEGALPHWRRAAELAPESQRVQIALAESLARRGDVDGAITAYTAAARLGALDARSHLNLGTALMRAGDPASAIDHLEGSLRLRPDSALAHFNLGEAYDLLGRAGEAIAHYEAAVRLEPGHRARKRLEELRAAAR